MVGPTVTYDGWRTGFRSPRGFQALRSVQADPENFALGNGIEQAATIHAPQDDRHVCRPATLHEFPGDHPVRIRSGVPRAKLQDIRLGRRAMRERVDAVGNMDGEWIRAAFLPQLRDPIDPNRANRGKGKRSLRKNVPGCLRRSLRPGFHVESGAALQRQIDNFLETRNSVIAREATGTGSRTTSPPRSARGCRLSGKVHRRLRQPRFRRPTIAHPRATFPQTGPMQAHRQKACSPSRNRWRPDARSPTEGACPRCRATRNAASIRD